MVILHAARYWLAASRLARARCLAFGITALLAVNVAQGWFHSLVRTAATAISRRRARTDSR
jgi:uncharacterized membrane protein